MTGQVETAPVCHRLIHTITPDSQWCSMAVAGSTVPVTCDHVRFRAIPATTDSKVGFSRLQVTNIQQNLDPITSPRNSKHLSKNFRLQ